MTTCNCHVLNNDSVKDIEKKLGGKSLVYILAVDTEGNLTPLRNEIVKQIELDFPIKTKAIHSIDSAAFGRFEGSCVYYTKVGGNKVPHYFAWPENVPCPRGTSDV